MTKKKQQPKHRYTSTELLVWHFTQHKDAKDLTMREILISVFEIAKNNADSKMMEDVTYNQFALRCLISGIIGQQYDDVITLAADRVKMEKAHHANE